MTNTPLVNNLWNAAIRHAVESSFIHIEQPQLPTVIDYEKQIADLTAKLAKLKKQDGKPAKRLKELIMDLSAADWDEHNK